MNAKAQFYAACLQMNSSGDVDDNLQRAELLIKKAAAAGAELVVLPEFFPLLSADENAKLAIAEVDGDGPIQRFLADMAKQQGIYLIGGTVPIKTTSAADNNQPVFSACPFYAPDGQRLARYDKIHLFHFSNQQQVFDETKTIRPGQSVVAVDTPLGRIGLSVCYDLRFPELYRAMRQPDIISAPSAFVVETGRAHWELLLRARAVENLAYVLGAAQVGEHAGGRTTYGHSMIIGPWGNVLAAAQTEGDECLIAAINASEREQYRQRLPVLTDRCLNGRIMTVVVWCTGNDCQC